MKRFFALLLAVTLLIASGCGTSGNTQQADDPQTNNAQNSDTTNTTPSDDTNNETTDGAAGEGENTPETEGTVVPAGDYNPTVTGFKLGDIIADFSFTTYDRKTVTLSEVLAEKDAVLINIFATWCGPCKSEFPFMESAYQQFKDRVEIMALSGDGSDNADKIRQLATSLGLTFPMGMDTPGFMRSFNLNAFPTTIVLDRFGTIVFTNVGSFPDEASFVNLFEFLVSDEYTESVVLDTIPPEMPHLELLSSDVLSTAMDADGIVFENVPGAYNWPMAVTEVDGRNVLVSSNQMKNKSRCAVQTTVNVSNGDVFAFDLKLSSEESFDFFVMSINGEVAKVFSGEEGWTSYAYQFAADGEYLIELAYVKDDYTEVGEDTLWLDNARILSGEEASAALAANATYPTAEETSSRITNKNVTQVFFEDPYGIVYKIFGCPYEAYIVGDLKIDFAFNISAEVDPEAAICYDNRSTTYALTSLISGNGYTVSFEVDSIETTGKGYTYVVLDPDVMTDNDEYPILLFANVEGLEKFAKTFAAGSWCKADELESAPWYQPEVPQSDVTYILRSVDENGEAIPGVTLQVCNDSTCSVYVTDANGECVLTLAADHYEIHVLKAPEGYAFDSSTVIEAPIEGGEVTICLNHV